MPERGQDKDGAWWVRMAFKKNKVWVEEGEPGLPKAVSGRARMKYNLKQDYEYKVLAANLVDLEKADLVQKKSKKTGAGKTKPKSTSKSFSKSTEEKGTSALPPDADPEGIHIYTDGACSGNPGPAGIGVVLCYKDKEKKISEFIGEGTNNIAELMAIWRGLAEVKKPDLPVYVYTDSSYAFGLLTKNWKAKKNVELVAKIRRMMPRFPRLKLIKVPGHAGNPGNEMADQLAVEAVEQGRES